jgi:hypothetical protein
MLCNVETLLYICMYDFNQKINEALKWPTAKIYLIYLKED